LWGLKKRLRGPHVVQLPFCLICEKTFSNETIKPSRLKDYLSKIHPDKLYIFIRRKFDFAREGGR